MFFFFFFNDTATTEIYTLSLHDALPISRILARAEEFAEMGLVLEPFGVGAVLVRETPALLGKMDAANLLRDLADDLSEYDEALSLKERFEQIGRAHV